MINHRRKANPTFTWGWIADINYKNLEVESSAYRGRLKGNDIYNLQKSTLNSLGAQQFHAVYGDYRDRLTPTNPSNIPSGRNGTEIFYPHQFIEDGSYYFV